MQSIKFCDYAHLIIKMIFSIIWIRRRESFGIDKCFFSLLLWNAWLGLSVPIWWLDGMRQYWSIVIMWRILIFHWRKHYSSDSKSHCANAKFMRTHKIKSLCNNEKQLWCQKAKCRIRLINIRACIEFCLQTQAIEIICCRNNT